MATKEYFERLKLFKDSIKLKKPDRVPNMANFYLEWIIPDNGCDIKEAFYDWELHKKVYKEFQDIYDFDCYSCIGHVHAWEFTDILGGGAYTLDTATGVIETVEKPLLDVNEILPYLKDPIGWSKTIFSRKYPDVTMEKFQRAVSEFFKFQQYTSTIENFFYEEVDRPLRVNSKATFSPPVESLISLFRGIKCLGTDMRRNPEILIEFNETMFNNMTKPMIDGFFASNPPQDRFACDVFTPLLAHSIMSPKQFRQYYWPYLKQIIAATHEAGKTMLLFPEADILRFKDFFQELPKEMIVLLIEMDDIFEVRKEIPGICIAGGMPTTTLGKKTPQECIDMAKKLIDGMGEGYIFSENKNVSYTNDCKRENILAVNEFIRNYKI